LIRDLRIQDAGEFSYVSVGRLGSVNTSAKFPLYLMREAWEKGVDFEDLADGFGPGLGTMGGDWSGIRDSSPAAQEAMLERALNELFEREDENV
jgi:aryl-alcohol dehydrogenase-like predicted oxidoreductase